MDTREGATTGRSQRSSRLVRRYLSSRRLRDRVFQAFSAAFDGLWLGLFSREQLHLLDEAFYERVERVGGEAYDYRDDAYNARGLSDWEDAAIREYFHPNSRVVVTGAGGGREVLALLERGFDALGYEPNEKFVGAGADFLSRRGHRHRLQPCERDAFPDGVERCDAVLVGWGSYMLIAGRQRRVAFLHAARQNLREGDPILLSFFAYPERPRYLVIVARIANAVRYLRRREPAEPGDVIAGNFTHYFTPDEIEDELEAGGFRLVDFQLWPYAHAVGRAV